MLRCSLVLALFSSVIVTTSAAAQDGATAPPAGPFDLRALHERVAAATVLIVTPSGSGTGWLFEHSGRALVVTNRQTAERVDARGARVLFYAGLGHAPLEVRAHRGSLSAHVDLGTLLLDADAPPTAHAVRVATDTAATRGQRIVLGNNAIASSTTLPFQTLEGVVSGQVAGRDVASCSGAADCIVVDAPALAGASGGPALDGAGELVGMLWEGPRGPLAYLVPARTIADELATRDRAGAAAAAVAATPPTLPTAPPQDAVARVLNAARTRIAACGSSGTVRVGIVADGATGAVTRIELDGVPFDSATGRCVRTAIGALRFPRFSRPSFRITFPYQLGGPARR